MSAAFADHGTPSAEIVAELERAAGDYDPLRGGPASHSLEVNDELQSLILRASSLFLTHNSIWGDALPSLATMEREVVRMSLDILGGSADARGYMTLGGSESIFAALHAARTKAEAERSACTPFEVIAPSSIHAAFTKACHYLGLRLVKVPAAADLRADVASTEEAITPSTIAVCGSAPQWPHHRFDPIVELGALAANNGLWMHVDACVGGFLAPFVREAGWPVPDFDLTVPGVCSISADLHKWGYAAKPCSTVLYSSAELAAWQPHPPVEWDCGVYDTATPAGSRPGAAVAAAWAVLRYLGRDGFVQLARDTMLARDRLIAGIEEIDGLRTQSTDLAMVVYGSDTLDVGAIGDGLEDRGWLVMRLVAPEPMLQLLVDRTTAAFIDAFLVELAGVVANVRDGGASEARRRSKGPYG